MFTNNAAYKYETPYNGLFLITKCWKIVSVALQCGPIQISNNIRRVNTYTYDTNVEDINP